MFARSAPSFKYLSELSDPSAPNANIPPGGEHQQSQNLLFPCHLVENINHHKIYYSFHKMLMITVMLLYNQSKCHIISIITFK